MANLGLPGLFTGIDTSTLIAQLIAVERRTINIYQERKTLWEERKDALGSLETSLSTLRTTLNALSDADSLRAFSTSSSDTGKVTAEASYNTFEGNHTVVINQLANAERWVQTDGLEYIEDYVGEGTFIYSYNHKETSITTTATTTLEELVGLINNDPNNPGVTASLLHYNNAYHLVLNGNDAGTDYRILVNASSTEVWEADSAFTTGSGDATLSTKITELAQFTANNGLQGDEQIQITGTDHGGGPITQVNLNITENTTVGHLISEINDAFDGIAKATLENGEIILTDNTSGTSNLSITLAYNQGSGDTTLTLPTMSVSTEGGSTTADLVNFAPSDFTMSQAAQDSKIKVDGFPSTAPVAEVQHLNFNSKANSGTWTLTYDGQTTAAIAHNATVAEVQAALEALSNVSAGDITVGGDELTLNNGTMTFTFSDTLGDANMLVIDASDINPLDPANWVFTEQTKGQDGYISRSSNTVDDVISGVTLHLHDTTDTGGEEITLTRDIQSVKTKLTAMVTAYNSVVTYIKERTGYNEETNTAGVLMGDYVVSTIKSEIRTPVIAPTSGFVADIDSFLMPAHIGFEIDRNGVLSFNGNVFDEAIAKDYMGVLALIGADKTGSSDSNDIEFYGAHSNYTTAGDYMVKVEYDAAGDIDKAWIKLAAEGDSQYREAIISGNVITGDSTFHENGNPVYPESSLQVTVPTTGAPSSTIYATVRVKQGFAGAIEDALDRMLKASSGTIRIDQEHAEDVIKGLDEKIEKEEYRLTLREARLVAKFARLEQTLALLQRQMNLLNFAPVAG
ncbi:MAG: flagellar filament capping protein FliD [Phycisphaerae bacterium]|nr:flagellar filament capping protein FliD [Phycisphaerae bacterium]NIP52899.1 flagellar filament capping protein FliD [Phycisphaerae bacterium]NIS51950.1 flagellar filament capping protein FliD [Phycisphaerae bacterium]NIU09464.1 flagellar filament capping protein FliD [Phycisphaerae bacterium]NIU57197.1 flagellar filament capping protein FliD [Phycisphaerae bacterium]